MKESQWFEPQEVGRFFAAGEAIFLIDPRRLNALRTSNVKSVLPELLKPGRLYAEGAVVPALGVERGAYTVMVRSTETEGALVPLTHIAFSTGFVLGTETGELIVANAERLQTWNADAEAVRIVLDGQEAGAEDRKIRIAPGWFGVTVVAGIREAYDGEEEWVLCFLLEPQAEQPEFEGDLKKVLNIFGQG